MLNLLHLLGHLANLLFVSEFVLLAQGSARFSRSHATKNSRLHQIRDQEIFIYQQVQTKFLPVWSLMK